MKKKPEPPADLWTQIEKAVAEVVSYIPPKPPNAFTIAEFAAKLNLTIQQARGRIEKLKTHGKIRRVGGESRCGYYEFIG